MERYSGQMLKIFINESDEYNGEPVYSLLLKKFEELNVSGVTMLRGVEGFGLKSKVHSEFVEVLLKNLPIVIEIVEKKEKIEEIISIVKLIIPRGTMALIKDVDMIRCINDFE